MTNVRKRPANLSNWYAAAMLKKSVTVFGLLLLAFIAYLYVQAVRSGHEPATGMTGPNERPAVTTIAFGSCNRQTAPQDYWSTIASHDPAAWLWLGDNVYSDTDNMEQMRADYATQTDNSHYAAFVAATPAIYGAWDDHDYGRNDAGKEWPAKKGAKALMMDFLDVPPDAEVRRREGTYQSYLVDDVRIILLDTRYFRDELAPPVREGDRYGPNPDGDILGEAQWAWLEKELRNSTARAHLIASSIQVLPTQHGYEKWANFPRARMRLLNLLATVRPALPLLLSGDRHLAEIMVEQVGDYPVFEMTASGLTHSYEGADEANDKRRGPLVTQRNYGLLHFVDDGNGNLQLLAEVRAISDDAILTSLALPDNTTNRKALPALVYAKDSPMKTLKPCPDTPNCVSSQATQPKKKRDAIAFEGTAEQAKKRLMMVVGDMARTTLVKDDGNYLHYTFKTWPIPYTDDVEFIIDPDRKVIDYRSASRVGKSDLGVNSRRMAKVVENFKKS